VIVAHGDLHDWLVDGDDSAVFVGDQVMVLSTLATAILDLVTPDGQASLEEVAAGLVARFGDPPGSAEELARDKVTELVKGGVLRIVEDAAADPATETA
jgi:hypothetical protein